MLMRKQGKRIEGTRWDKDGMRCASDQAKRHDDTSK